MKAEAIGANLGLVRQVPLVQSRWTTAVVPVESIGERLSRGPSQEDLATRQQLRDLRTMALSRPRDDSQAQSDSRPRPEIQPAQAAAGASASQAQPAPRRDDDRPGPSAHGYEGTDMSTLSGADFGRMTQTLRSMAPSLQAEQASLESAA